MSVYRLFIRPILFWFDPERVHGWTLKLVPLIAMLLRLRARPSSTKLRLSIAGLNFDSPVGLAAGFDKDALCFSHMYDFGFSSVEVGTLTPLPQLGNDEKRIFRIKRNRAIINRMGFPNFGIDAAVQRLRKSTLRGGPLGVNVGANKDSLDRAADYVLGYRKVAKYADYVTVNVSSPNTPGLRNLESGDGLRALISLLDAEIERIRVPIFIKVSPDLDPQQIDEVCSIIRSSKVSALIVGNTTTTRPKTLAPQDAAHSGGLSGEPLAELSKLSLQRFYANLGPDVPIISVGGIATAQDVFERVTLGASMVQIYTGLIYEGPNMVRKINSELVGILEAKGYPDLASALGTNSSSKTVVVRPAPIEGVHIAEHALVA
ncbi:MAG: quinone-dependent dihydroorotate dehydrogenase [Novosphingobium sp.]